MTDEAPLEPALVDAVTEDAPEASRPRRRRSTRSWIIEWGAIIVVAVLVAFVVRTYIVQTFYIPSGSMEPTLQVGDRILVSKLSTEFGSVHIGDILVFKRPPKENCGGAPVPFLVKRVIGLPGDHLTSKGNTIYVNGDLVVPPGKYFMMGDNHGDSCDSRYWGPLPANLVVGKAVLRIWPLSRFGTL